MSLGGPPLHLLLFHHTPPPVLVPLQSDPSHFCSPVHENRPVKVGDVDALPHLPVQAATFRTALKLDKNMLSNLDKIFLSKIFSYASGHVPTC